MLVLCEEQKGTKNMNSDYKVKKNCSAVVPVCQIWIQEEVTDPIGSGSVTLDLTLRLILNFCHVCFCVFTRYTI